MLEDIGADLKDGEIDGEWIGLAKFSGVATGKMKDILAEMRAAKRLDGASMIDVFQGFMARGEDVRVLYITGHWLDVDNSSDLESAQKFL